MRSPPARRRARARSARAYWARAGILAGLAAIAAPLTPARAGAQLTALRPLAFGTIITGTTTTVAATDASAAAWRIRGILGVSGGITLTLPSVLTRVGGGESMPVSFCATCAVYRINGTTPVGGTAFDPNTGVQGLYVVVLSDVYVWLGGSVSPPRTQAPGNYVGTVVLTVSALL